MLKKKVILKWVLLVTLGIWLIVSVFFYFQHRIQIDTYYIGEYIEFDEFSIFIKNIERYNFEENRMNYPDNILKLELPLKITQAILEINYFYSKPYDIDEELYKYKVNCEIIFSQEYSDSEGFDKNIYDKISIGVYNEESTSLNPTYGYQSQYSSNVNVIQYSGSGDWKENYSNGVKIINNDNSKEYLFLIEKPFITNIYGYFNRRIDDRLQMANDIIRNFLLNYYNGNLEDSENYINEDYVENFPWSTFIQYEYFEDINFEFSYLGKYKDKEKVFIMNISENRDNGLIESFDFYMIYEDFNWQIIDAK
jgi:hypothetical protein